MIFVCKLESRSTFQALYQLLNNENMQVQRTAGVFKKKKNTPQKDNFKDASKSFRKDIKFHTETTRIVSSDHID